jgi:CheY-like chemotaxis protein
VKTLNLVVDWGVITLPRSGLPRPRYAALESGADARAARQRQGQGLRILMVEDDPALSMMYRVRLEAAGYTVVVATNAEEALRRVSNPRAFDLVFLDIGLPGTDGLSLLESIRESKTSKDVPVVILSNYSEPPMKKRGLALGATAYLVKSEVTPSWLVAHIPGWTHG